MTSFKKEGTTVQVVVIVLIFPATLTYLHTIQAIRNMLLERLLERQIAYRASRPAK